MRATDVTSPENEEVLNDIDDSRRHAKRQDHLGKERAAHRRHAAVALDLCAAARALRECKMLLAAR